MTTTPNSQAVANAAGGPRQFLVLGLCAVGIVVAAFAAPAAGPAPTPPDIPLPSVGESDCQVTLDSEPVPGQDVTVTVRRNGSAVSDVRVWFNGDVVGQTDADGRVSGEVPYERTLQIRVGVGQGSCRFSAETADDGFTTADGPADGATTDDGTTDRSGPGLAATAAAPADPIRAQFGGGDDGNQSGSIPIDHGIDIGVRDDPYPGENVTLSATIDGNPVPEATVTVDGREVGPTDADGQVTIPVPDDRTRQITVRVQRGQITGERRVDVLLLEVDVRGDGLFAVPGQDGTVHASIADRPESGANVSVGGEPVGTTGVEGTVGARLPADPTTTVTVSTADQTARTTLWPAYGPIIAFTALLLSSVVGAPLAGYRWGGRAGLSAVGVVFLAATAGATGYLVGDWAGALVAVALVAVAVLAGLLVAHRATVVEAGAATGPRLRSFVRGVTREGIWVTRRIERLVDRSRVRARDAVGWLGDRQFDPAHAVVRVGGWLRSIPGRLLALLSTAVAWPGAAFADAGDDREAAAADESATDAATERGEGSPVADATVRDLWRGFARLVVPERWPRRTPGEVSRRAIEAGFPRDAVEELTTVFRDVEYGGESISADRYERARSAFESLTGAASDDEEVRDR